MWSLTIRWRERVLLASGLILLVSVGCDFDCESSESCLWSKRCLDGTCAQCCGDADCSYDEVCRAGYCQDSCDNRCNCDFQIGTCFECCLSEPGCECCNDADCPPGLDCEEVWGPDEFNSHQCVPPCQAEGQDCGPDIRACCDGLACHENDSACVPTCQLDADCGQGEIPFTSDRECADGLCLFVACQGEAECLDTQRCFEGVCLSPVACDQLAFCSVMPSLLELDPGEQVRLEAGAFSRDDEALPVAGFEWSSDDPQIVSVDADGLVTAGDAPGQTYVKAEVVSCLFVCSARVIVRDP